MAPRELTIDVDGGQLGALDHAGAATARQAVRGQVLLVHGSGHNAAAWDEVAAALGRHAYVVAVDLRGHGRSTAGSTDAEQYWRDLATITAALGWARPVLVGHSTGGYAVTAVTAAGLVTPAALCVIDGFVLDDRRAAAQAHAAMATEQALEELREVFGYGWRGSQDDARAAVARAVAHREQDRLNAGASADLVRAVTERSYAPVTADAALWARRPSLEEIAAVAAPTPGAEVYPSVDVYERVSCPMVAVLAGDGLYASRREELAAVVGDDPNRTLVDVDGGHNLVMTAPAAVAAIVDELLPTCPPLH